MHITKSLGHYYITSSDKQWCVQMRLPTGAFISELWPEDEEPEIDGLPPSEIVELISARLESYWVKTNREEVREKIKWCRENSAALDAEWAKAEIERLEKQAGRLTKKAKSLREDYLSD